MFNIKDIDKMIDIARKTINSAPMDFPQNIKDVIIGSMVGMYLKGYKDGLKTLKVTSEIMLNEFEKGKQYFDKLYNLKEKL